MSVPFTVSHQITVLVAGEGRHLFDGIRDQRIRVVNSDSAAQPDLLVFPCSRHRRFENVAELALSERLRRRIEQGEVGLVFDVSLEGVLHKPDITAALHSVIQRLGAKPRQCAYVTQDRQYEADYRAHCETLGVEPAAVLVHDYWIWDALSHYEHNGDEIFEQRLAAFRVRQARRRRKFVSLNRTPRPTKVLFLLRLLRDGLWDHGFISFGGFRRNVDGPGKDRPTAEQLQQSLPGFEELVTELSPFIDRLDAHGRVLFGLEQHGWKTIDLSRANMAADFQECDESWFTIVTETEMRPRLSRITEKVLKPLANFHPLLILGNPHALKMIRAYGFATFEDVFDEAYDEEQSPRHRFDLVYEQFRRASERSEHEWTRLEQRIAEKLIANAKWALTRLPSTCRRENDAMLVNQIVEATRRSTPSQPALG